MTTVATPILPSPWPQPRACHDDVEEAVRDSEIKEVVAARPARLVESREMLAQTVVGFRVGKVALQIRHAVAQPLPGRLVDMVGLELALTGSDEFIHHVGEALAPLLHVAEPMVDADQPEAVRQPFRCHQVVERRCHQSLRQIASGTENDHGAGRRDRRRRDLAGTPCVG